MTAVIKITQLDQFGCFLFVFRGDDNLALLFKLRHALTMSLIYSAKSFVHAVAKTNDAIC